MNKIKLSWNTKNHLFFKYSHIIIFFIYFIYNVKIKKIQINEESEPLDVIMYHRKRQENPETTNIPAILTRR